MYILSTFYHLKVPKPNSARYHRSIIFRAVSNWNRLEPHLRTSKDKKSFKAALKRSNSPKKQILVYLTVTHAIIVM